MLVRNTEQIFNKEDLFYCYSLNLKKFLCKTKGISFIGKGINSESKKEYWLFIRSEELNSYLEEWSTNAKNGIKAISGGD